MGLNHYVGMLLVTCMQDIEDFKHCDFTALTLDMYNTVGLHVHRHTAVS